MGLVATLVDGLASAVHATRERAVEDEHLYLSGLFKPLHEEHAPTVLTATAGSLPEGLSGLCVLRRCACCHAAPAAPLRVLSRRA
jgi:hypothetical protein